MQTYENLINMFFIFTKQSVNFPASEQAKQSTKLSCDKFHADLPVTFAYKFIQLISLAQKKIALTE